MPFKPIHPNISNDETQTSRNIVWVHGFGIAIEHDAVQSDDVIYCELLWDEDEQLLGIKLHSNEDQTLWKLKNAGPMKVVHDISKAGLNLPHGVYPVSSSNQDGMDLICDFSAPLPNLKGAL